MRFIFILGDISCDIIKGIDKRRDAAAVVSERHGPDVGHVTIQLRDGSDSGYFRRYVRLGDWAGGENIG
jgi:hypothetical protein